MTWLFLESFGCIRKTLPLKQKIGDVKVWDFFCHVAYKRALRSSNQRSLSSIEGVPK